MRKPTREEVVAALSCSSVIAAVADAVMALFEDKPMSTCNHVSWTLADGGKVVCDGCGLACGLTMELASKPTPKWEEEFDVFWGQHYDRRGGYLKHPIVDCLLKDFIREKLREIVDDINKEGMAYGFHVDAVKREWGL